MKAFILVVFMQSNFGGGVTALPTEYKTLKACTAALTELRRQTDQVIPGDPLVRGACLPKG